MRVWRVLVWLVPLATLVPLTDVAYRIATFDFSAYFAGVDMVVLVGLVAIPNAIILAASVVGALTAGRHPRAPLVIAAAAAAYQLTPLPWQPSFWDWNERAALFIYYALPGTIAAVVAICGLVLFARHARVAAVVVAALLLLPLLSTGGAAGQRILAAQRYCPPGPAVDLTFSGAENAHFTTSCGIPDGISTLAGCKDLQVGVEMMDWLSWNLFFPAQRIKRANNGPYLIVGGSTSYGMDHWSGDYAFDPGNDCAGTVDAYLYSGDGPQATAVHVTGRFQAP